MPDSSSITFNFHQSHYAFLPTGDVHSFLHRGILINQFLGNALEGSANNLWLRVHSKEGVLAYPLLGVNSLSVLEQSASGLRYRGEASGILYCVSLLLQDCGWFWDISLQGHGETVDVICGQDVGLAAMGDVLENELFASQYLGHSLFESDNGYVICSRQNLPQSGRNPYLQCGMLHGKAVGYSTDGFQFYGLSYKHTDIPHALIEGLPTHNLQFECAYLALQSETITLTAPQRIVFYGYFQPDHPSAIETLEYRQDIRALFQAHAPFSIYPAKVRKRCFGAPLASTAMDEDQLSHLYPIQKLPEYKDATLLSFVTEDHTHVALSEKERIVERPHATVLTNFADLERVSSSIIATTCCMYGQFCGHTVIGNTNKHKLFSAPRGLLNNRKASGVRLWVKIGSEYRLLTMPAVFESGLSHARWRYRIGEDWLTVTTFVTIDHPEVYMTVSSAQNVAYDLIVTAQLVMGVHEDGTEPVIIRNGDTLWVRPAQDSPILSVYPELHYRLTLPMECTVSDERIFFEDGEPAGMNLLTLRLDRCSRFEIRIAGTLEGEIPTYPSTTCERETQAAIRCYSNLLRHFHLEKTSSAEADILNETAFSFAHNAMIHFASPHGLEQSGGAAWGTRDICQGPFEFFLATRHTTLARHILLLLFSHQRRCDGQWPQWFMYDRYSDQMDECHGDVIFWPLKCLGDYLRSTGDYTILTEALSYSDDPAPITLLAHLDAALDAIRRRFVSGTHLLSYAGGDWDDTLQPVHSGMKENLVSSWTQALAYQALDALSESLPPSKQADMCREMSGQIQHDFQKHLVVEGIIAGFILRQPDGSFIPLLHPSDSQTGIQYRLIPMTRSIIASLSDEPLALESLSLIDSRLRCPDGVRLMDRPATYHGGVCRLFRRAEQAANVGREISLQYTHAHIRYIEALCRAGRRQDAWRSLFEINPICITETVPTALPRQRNMYFSSSDGCFSDRYEYARDFSKLFSGAIPVKGGWRLYSSGPGIYLATLIRDVLGISREKERLVIDPALPLSMDGLAFTFHLDGIPFSFVYHLSSQTPTHVRICQGNRLVHMCKRPNPYRAGGVSVALAELDPAEPIHIHME